MLTTLTPTLEQIETLRDLFLKRVEKENFGKSSKDGFHPKDIERVRTSDRWLQLFLEQCDLDMKQSLNMLWDTCQWRKNYGTNDINENNINLDYLKSGIMFPHNKDIDGKILLIFKTKLHIKGTRNVDELIRCLVYWIERLQSQTNYDQLTIFFDMQSCGLSNMDMDFTKRIIDTFKYYYPNSLNYIIIFEMPWALSAAFRIIKALLPPKAVARMKFVTPKTMTEFIAQENMLRSWGGDDDYEFKFEPLKKQNNNNNEISNDSPKSQQNNSLSKKVHFANSSPTTESLMSSTGPGIDKINGGASDVEMLRITPDDAIIFRKHGNDLSGTVEFVNICQNMIAYKVKTTSPEKFRVRPSNGVLTPGENTTIFVGLQKGQELSAASKDKFLVMCMIVNEEIANNSQAIAGLWKNTTTNSPNVEHHRLKCSLPHSETNNNDGGGVINGCLNSNGFGIDPDKQISNFNSKLSLLTERTENLQKQLRKTHRLQWMTLLLFLFFTIGVAIIFKDELLNRQTCSNFNRT